ncbi:aldehyde dehydrogenase family protein, partial [Acinetobacter baumannii]
NAFWNQGQVCIARTRLIAHKDVKTRLLERLLHKAEAFVPADPMREDTTFGPLASSAQRARVKTYVEKGMQEGAEAVLKGAIQDSGGCYVAP